MTTNSFSWRGLPVGVTGGTGFLGYHLACQLAAAGAQVTILGLPPKPGHPLWQRDDITIIHGDVRDLDVVQRALRDSKVIFHTAGIVAVWGPALERMRQVHVVGTENVIRAAPADARIVHTSSIVAVGAATKSVPVDEDAPFLLDRVKVDYIHSKREAERVALRAAAQGRDVVVTNPGYLIGPEDYEGSVMGRFCARFWRGRLPVTLSGGYNLVDVRDAAAGHLLAAQHGRAGRRYILGGENHSFRAFMRLLAETAGFAPRAYLPLPGWGQTLLAGASEGVARWRRREPYPSLAHVRLNRFHWYARSDRAASELGYRARPLAESLRDAYAWHHGVSRFMPRGFCKWWLRPREPADPAARRQIMK